QSATDEKAAFPDPSSDSSVSDESSRPFDFSTPQSLESEQSPLAPWCLDIASRLHGVRDPAWEGLNDKRFQYGTGGANTRQAHMFLSSSVNDGHTQNAA